MRAYVLARKGVLLSSPDVKAMSQAQWAFEFYALQKKEEDLFKVYFKVMRNLLVNVLGLNSLRPTDEKGLPKSFEAMTDDEKEGFLPLIAWCARPEMLKPVAEQLQLATDEHAATNPDKQYEELLAKMDKAVEEGGDMDPILSTTNVIIPKDPRYEQQFKQMGIKKVSDVEIDVDGNI
jgi:hypothetical protein